MAEEFYSHSSPTTTTGARGLHPRPRGTGGTDRASGRLWVAEQGAHSDGWRGQSPGHSESVAPDARRHVGFPGLAVITTAVSHAPQP